VPSKIKKLEDAMNQPQMNPSLSDKPAKVTLEEALQDVVIEWNN